MGCSDSKAAIDVNSPPEGTVITEDPACTTAIADAPAIDPAHLVMDFGRLMKSAEARKVLLDFAMKEHSEENVLFYDKAIEFRQDHSHSLDDSELEAMRKDAIRLIDTFLKDDAEHSIGVQCKNPFKKGLPESVTPAANMFDTLCRAVHKNMEHDIFPRFKQSALCRELITRFPNMIKRMSGSGTSNRSTTRRTDPSPDPIRGSARRSE